MVENARERILIAALAILREPAGPSLSLESAARRAGLSKPGLMYHFPTKDALVSAVVRYTAERWAAAFQERLPVPVTQATAQQRIRAYAEVCLSGTFDRADLAVYFDAHHRDLFTAVWVELMHPWLDLPPDLPAELRGRLTAVRLIADGYWLADSTGVFPPREDECARLRAITDDMLEAQP